MVEIRRAVWRCTLSRNVRREPAVSLGSLAAMLRLRGDDDKRSPHRGRWSSAAVFATQERRVHLRREHAKRIGAPAGDDGVIPGGAEGAEERDVSFIERLAAEELVAPAIDPASGGGDQNRVVRRPSTYCRTCCPSQTFALTPSGRRPPQRLRPVAARHPHLPALRPLPRRKHQDCSCCSRWSRSSHRSAGRARCRTRRYAVEGVGDAARVPSDAERIRIERDGGRIAHLRDTGAVEIEALVVGPASLS
jgi:hypothetical protein